MNIEQLTLNVTQLVTFIIYTTTLVGIFWKLKMQIKELEHKIDIQNLKNEKIISDYIELKEELKELKKKH